MSILGAALMLAQRGYAVHWVRPYSKAPVAEGWSTAPIATITELRQTYRPGYNLGARCGQWSQPMPGHGLVVLDVDIRDAEATHAALTAVETLVGPDASPVVLSGSGNGSRHLWFACPVEQLPLKANVTLLAADTWKLELLSGGKQIVVPPSMHPSGQPYRWLIPVTGALPLLPASVQDAIHETLAPTAQKAITQGHVVHGWHGNGPRPGDDFNRRADWTSILLPHGWVPVRQRGDMTDWRRPGKDEGISATTNYADSGVLYVFSTNAAPFEPDTAYTPFAAYTLLNHHGDFGAAARVLGPQGYGVRQQARAPRVDHDPWLGPRTQWHGVPLAVRRA